jgi:undecaprenyl-diphosphatase
MEEVRVLFQYGGADSFPSGHATTYGALATSAYFYSKRLGLVFGNVALLIGFSRIALGIHWPFDILTGFIIGFLVSYMYYVFVLKRKLF